MAMEERLTVDELTVEQMKVETQEKTSNRNEASNSDKMKGKVIQ